MIAYILFRISCHLLVTSKIASMSHDDTLQLKFQFWNVDVLAKAFLLTALHPTHLLPLNMQNPALISTMQILDAKGWEGG